MAAPRGGDPEAIASMESVSYATDGVRRSQNDHRAYRYLKLANQMQVLLVSDAESDKAAACMDVSVGYASDPPELPGLAHFLEHMLFLGTEKYPDESSYSSFLASHGGFSNASTDFETTNFYFDVMHPHLSEALDRFAQFFLCPLFTESATARELNAIDSENAKNLQSDQWRLMQLQRWAANPEHPYHKFGTGNLETLADVPERWISLRLRPGNDGAVGVDLKAKCSPPLPIREALFRFHREHYSANVMRLAVFGRQSLDELQQLVAPLFAAVPNKDRSAPEWGVLPFGEKHFGAHLSVVPVRDFRSLSVAWAMPPLKGLYRSKPHRFLSHLLGHESEGSLLSFLKEKGLVDTLVAGESVSVTDFAIFEVQMALSEEGDECIEIILAYVFMYLRMLASAPPARWVHDECAAMGEMSFRFQEAMEPVDLVQYLSNALEHFPAEEVMSSSYLFETFEPDRISSLLGLLTPERAMTVHVSASNANEEDAPFREAWYGTQFGISRHPADMVEQWAALPIDEALHLPEPNPFIPTDFTLECDRIAEADAAGAAPRQPTGQPAAAEGADAAPADADAGATADDEAGATADDEAGATADDKTPPTAPPLFRLRRLREVGAVELWHKTDAKFRRPRGNVYINVLAPAAYYSPPNVVFTSLFAKLFADELTEYSYHADLAGLHYRVSNCNTGLRVMLSGYSHKLPVLLNKVMEKLANPVLREERFALQLDILTREYANYFKDQPYSHATYMSNCFLEIRRWHILDYLSFVTSPRLTFDFFCRFVLQSLLQRCRLQVLCHGNFSTAQAEKMVADAEARLPFEPLYASERSPMRLLQLPTGTEVWLRQHRSGFSELQLQHSNPDDTNSAVELYLQVGRDVRPHTMLVELLAQIVHKSAEQQLRTVEQLGYIVWCTVRYDMGVVGLRFIIQSSSHDAAALDARIEAFLDGVPALLEKLSDGEFDAFKQALVDIKLEKDKRLREETSKYWNEIVPHGTYDFERCERDAAVVAELTKARVIAFWAEHLARTSPNRRKLSAQVFAAHHPLPPPPTAANVVCLDRIEQFLDFKKSLCAYPAPGPCERWTKYV